jgi:O-antigen/teichoic acid export membrane protein
LLATETRIFGRSARVFTGYAFSSVALTGATIVSGLLILRWLEPAEVGVWQTMLVVQAYLTITRLGIPNAFNREMPFHLGRGETDIARRFAETTLLHAIVAGLFSFVVLIAAWPFFAPRGYTWQWAFPAAALMAACMSYRTYLFATLRSSADFKSVAYIQLINACTTLLAPVAVWRLGFIGLCLHGAAEAVAITTLTHHIRPIRVRPRFHRDALRSLLTTGIHLFITSYLFTAALTFDRVVLLLRGDISLVGLYAPALAVASAMAVLPNAVAIYAYPRLSYAHGEGAPKAELWRITSQSMWVSAVLGIPIALIVVLALPTITRTFVPKYIESVTVMQYAAVSGVFMGMTTGSAVLRSLKAWRLLYLFMITFVVLRWTLPFLTSASGDPLRGVALGSLIASAGAALLTWIVTRRAVFAVDRSA